MISVLPQTCVFALLERSATVGDLCIFKSIHSIFTQLTTSAIPNLITIACKHHQLPFLRHLMSLGNYSMTSELYHHLIPKTRSFYYRKPKPPKLPENNKQPSKQRFSSNPTVSHFLEVVKKHEDSIQNQKKYQQVKKKPTICNYRANLSLKREKLYFGISRGFQTYITINSQCRSRTELELAKRAS